MRSKIEICRDIERSKDGDMRMRQGAKLAQIEGCKHIAKQILSRAFVRIPATCRAEKAG